MIGLMIRKCLGIEIPSPVAGEGGAQRRMRVAKLSYYFMALLGLFACNINAEDATKLLNEINNNLTVMKSDRPKCHDLNDIVCVQRKINYFFNIDQYMRNQYIRNRTAKIHNAQVEQLLKKIDLSNTNEMKKILKLHGWVVISKFGKVTDQQAWLLIQHADHDPYFQAGVAFLLEQLVAVGETDQKNFAYLYDRVITNFSTLGLKQRYGTQANIKDNVVRINPFEGTLEELNLRRKKIGLNSIAEYQRELEDCYLNNANR